MRLPVRATALALLAVATVSASPASTVERAGEASTAHSRAAGDSGASGRSSGSQRDHFHYRLLAGLGFGRGIRFNNPYRLQTELGDDAESLSFSAPYLDAWVAGLTGAPDALLHGLSLRLAVATSGIGQEVLTPSYTAFWQASPRWALAGRAGLPIVLRPDANVGAEIAAGGFLFVTAGIGLFAEVAASLFYGAATLDAPRTAIPMVALSVGAYVDYEGLP